MTQKDQVQEQSDKIMEKAGELAQSMGMKKKMTEEYSLERLRRLYKNEIE